MFYLKLYHFSGEFTSLETPSPMHQQLLIPHLSHLPSFPNLFLFQQILYFDMSLPFLHHASAHRPLAIWLDGTRINSIFEGGNMGEYDEVEVTTEFVALSTFQSISWIRPTKAMTHGISSSFSPFDHLCFSTSSRVGRRSGVYGSETARKRRLGEVRPRMWMQIMSWSSTNHSVVKEIFKL